MRAYLPTTALPTTLPNDQTIWLRAGLPSYISTCPLASLPSNFPTTCLHAPNKPRTYYMSAGLASYLPTSLSAA